jgi:hypothetical protein
MKEVYKQKIDDIMVSVEGRVMLLEKMINGEKRADNNEAKQYIREIKKGLENVKELVSIS